MKFLTRILIGLCVSLLATFPAFAAVNTSASNTHSKIIFSSIQPSYYDIYLFNGTVPKRLTEDRHLDYNPIFSPDGQYIVFTSEKGGMAHLYLIDTENSKKPPVRLTDSEHFEDQATFTPDGKNILFVNARDGFANIYKMPFRPGQVSKLKDAINLTHSQGGNFHPAVSSDGKWIAFSSNRGFVAPIISTPQPHKNFLATNIFVMRMDGTGVKKITNNPAWDGSPAWSPDSQYIYFYSTRDGKPRIYRKGLTGQKVEAIGPRILSGLSPVFMPNGRLAFASKIYGRWMIVSTKPDGSDLEYVSDNRINYFAPKFHPKSSQLLCYGPGPTTEQNFLDEFPAGIMDGKRYANKPLGNGPFLMETGNKQIGDMKVGLYFVRGYFPILSKDTTRVASVAEFAKLVVSDLHGTEPKLIFRAPWGAIMGMDWSEDLKKFTAAAGMPFASPNTKNDIWVFDENGGNAKNITKNIPGNNAFPRFIPNGKKIIFRSATTGYKNIYSITPDGKKLTQLTFNKGVDTMPAVSPNGQQIAFSSLRKGQNYNLYLLQLMPHGKPGKITQLTNSKSLDVHPIFSPDGKWLAFASGRDGFLDEWPLIRVFSPQPFGEIYAIRIKDRKVIRLTESKWEASVPNWK